MNRIAIILFAVVVASPAVADAPPPRSFRWAVERTRLGVTAENVDVTSTDKGMVPAIAPRRCAFELLRQPNQEIMTVSCLKPGSDRAVVTLTCTAASPTGLAQLMIGEGATLEGFRIGCAK